LPRGSARRRLSSKRQLAVAFGHGALQPIERVVVELFAHRLAQIAFVDQRGPHRGGVLHAGVDEDALAPRHEALEAR